MHPSQFLESQEHLDLGAGVLDTLVLLTSSLFIACSVQAARAGAHRRALQLTYLGGFSGVLFLVIKGHEWAEQIVRGNTVTSSEFFTFYYMLTGCTPSTSCWAWSSWGSWRATSATHGGAGRP